jgi:hypothetical protein
VHAAGSVKHHVTDACWQRGLLVSSAAAANAEPVAEFTLAAILFANKRVLEIARIYREHRVTLDWDRRFPGFGNYRRTIGIVGASKVGRRVLELLRPFDVDVLIADPYLIEDLGVQHVELDELLARCDVVSLHAPSLPETRHLIDAARLARMPIALFAAGTVRLPTELPREQGRNGPVTVQPMLRSMTIDQGTADAVASRTDILVAGPSYSGRTRGSLSHRTAAERTSGRHTPAPDDSHGRRRAWLLVRARGHRGPETASLDVSASLPGPLLHHR